MRERARILVVVAHEVVAVVFSRRRTGAQMKDRTDAAEIVALVDASLELVSVEIVGKTQRHQVAPFFRTIEAIDDQDIVEAPAVERPHEGAANEAGAPGNDGRAVVEIKHVASG